MRYHIGTDDITRKYAMNITEKQSTFIEKQSSLHSSTFYQQKLEQYGEIYKTHLFGRPVIRVVGETNVNSVLSGENDTVTSYWPRSTRLMLDGGLLMEKSGPVHSLRKRAILKALTHKALDGYIPTFVALCRLYIRTWCQKRRVIMYPELRRLTFHVASKTLAGFHLSLDELDTSMNMFQDVLNGMFSLPIQLPFTSFQKGLTARKILLEKIEMHLNTCPPRCHGCSSILTFLQPLTEDGSLEKDTLKKICLDLLFASHETTSSAACFLILYVSKHRNVFCKLLKEFKENGILGIEGTPSLEFISTLKYLDNVVKETIRLCCPIGAGFRKVLKTFSLGGYQIPKGWLVAYSIRETLETSEFFKTPKHFDPDRWEDSNKTSRHFLCFGGGKRRCVGQDFVILFLKLLMIEMIRHCEWRVENLSPAINKFPTPHPKDGMPVSFQGRFNQ